MGQNSTSSDDGSSGGAKISTEDGKVLLQNAILSSLVFANSLSKVTVEKEDIDQIKTYSIYLDGELILEHQSRSDVAEIFRYPAAKYAYYICDSAALSGIIEAMVPKSKAKDKDGVKIVDEDFYYCPVCGDKVPKGIKHGWREHAPIYSING